MTLAQLQQVTKDIENYIRAINYALRVSDVRMVNYYPGSYTMEISNNVDQTQLHMSQLRCIRLATIPFRRKVSSVLNRMDHRTPHALKETIETEIRDKKGRQIWLMFHMVPMRDSEGHIERYFGLCRNMTDMVETENRLAVETAKAQETELLKQSFLTNMSYEIRTPLNTVVGFAELFESAHDAADEPVFVEEIKRNSNSLLQLVNDILFLSRLDANMIEYNKAETDFALVFEGLCQLGWSGVSAEVKTVVENPYECLVVDIDQEHLGMVIQKLCTNAVRYTHQGTIRARYEYRHKELAISIEDTGVGIDEKVLPRVFDRFARNGDGELCGTGLDLPIVKALVEQMGGTVEIQSELGKGSTFWVILPCTAKTLQKKREIII
jgi:signal transduction histidine kinase